VLSRQAGHELVDGGTSTIVIVLRIVRCAANFFFSSRRRHTRSVSAFLLNRSSELELAQCYNVLPQLDINNTIDHRPEGDEKWFLENEKTVTQFCRKLAAERPLKDIRDEYNY